ncbi:MAG: methyl-accepting chemotaxis protein, partial [Candidatus Adiutrix sp.]
ELTVYQNFLNDIVRDIVASTEASRRRTGIVYEIIDQANILSGQAVAILADEAHQTDLAIKRVNSVMVVGVLLALLVSLMMAIIIARSISRPIGRIVTTLSDGAHEVDNTSGQLSSSSDRLAQGATENAASLEETSAALEELASMTGRNADNAVEANALMRQAIEAVVRAEGSMDNVISAMGEISTSGHEISKIIKTIDEIAFQTNLLALNAAVEAARAGEAGAGFAVVADEVRNLAIRSADAAKNTADLIVATISNINKGSDMVNSTAETFKTVKSDSSKVAELVSEVAEASKEQSTGIQQITSATMQMDKVTQVNAASAEESASAATALSSQAGALLEAVTALTTLVNGIGQGAAMTFGPKVQLLSSSHMSSATRGATPTNRADDTGAQNREKTANQLLPMD